MSIREISALTSVPSGFSSYPEYLASGHPPTRFWVNQSTGLFVPANEFQIGDNVGTVEDIGAINEFDDALLKCLAQGWIRVNECCIDHHGPLSESSKQALDAYHSAHPEMKTLTYYDASTGQYINKMRTEQEVVKVAPTVVHEVEHEEEDNDWPLAVEAPFGM